MNLTPQLVVQVQDEVHVSLADGLPPPRLGPPPLLVLVRVLVQDGLELGGVVQPHGLDGSGQKQEQAHHSDPAQERKSAPHGAHKVPVGLSRRISTAAWLGISIYLLITSLKHSSVLTPHDVCFNNIKDISIHITVLRI